jgi:DNA replicative helicase MCM subunit Mcm2 (Cdc46/Mcm family)
VSYEQRGLAKRCVMMRASHCSEELVRQYRRGDYSLRVDMRHLSTFSKQLHDMVRDAPNDYLPIVSPLSPVRYQDLVKACAQFERAVRDTLQELVGEARAAPEGGEEAGEGALPEPVEESRIPPFQVVLASDMAATRIREITAAHVNKLVVVPGIIITASRTAPKATKVALRCRNCGNRIFVDVASAFGGAPVPRRCDGL